MHGKKESEESREAQMRGRLKQTTHKRGVGAGCPLYSLGWERSGIVMGGAGKVILDTNKGLGTQHPTPVPGHAKHVAPRDQRADAPIQGSPQGASQSVCRV